MLPRRTALIALAALPLAARADLVRLIALAKPSIIAVGTFSATDSPRFGFRGTAFAVGDGTVAVTNAHVLPPVGESPRPPQMMVLVPRGDDTPQLREASVLAVDRQHDLALIRFEGAPVPALRLAEPGSAREGQSIALIGYPIGGVLGYSAVTHRGIVASVTRIAQPAPTSQGLNSAAVARLREGPIEVLQLDATAYPGNSGGPVFDVETGLVIGVVNLVLVKSSRESALSSPTGISYAVPVRFVRELLAREGVQTR